MFYKNLPVQDLSKWIADFYNDKIAQDLHIKYLNQPQVAEVLYCFFIDNMDFINEKYKSVSDHYSNEFYNEIIKILRRAKKNGTALAMKPDEYIKYLQDKNNHYTCVS